MDADRAARRGSSLAIPFFSLFSLFCFFSPPPSCWVFFVFCFVFLPQGRPLESTEKRPLAVFLINENAFFFSLSLSVCVCVEGADSNSEICFFFHLFKLFIGNKKKRLFFGDSTPWLRRHYGPPSVIHQRLFDVLFFVTVIAFFLNKKFAE